MDGVRDIYEQVANFFTGSSSNLANSPSPTPNDLPRRSFSVSRQRKRSRQHSLAVMNEAFRVRSPSESSNNSMEKYAAAARIASNRSVNFAFANPVIPIDKIDEGNENEVNMKLFFFLTFF